MWECDRNGRADPKFPTRPIAASPGTTPLHLSFQAIVAPGCGEFSDIITSRFELVRSRVIGSEHGIFRARPFFETLLARVLEF